jgi:large subunit ribosomal protein L31
MKKDIHPPYHEVIFKDVSCDFEYKTFSTRSSEEKMKWKDGKEYPVIKVGISSASHPFFTGKHRLVDAEGRAERFAKKYQGVRAKK